MISQFFVLSQRGDNIVFRDYRGDVPKGSAEIFFRKVKFWKEDGEEEAPPVFVVCPMLPNVDGVNYFHVKVVGLLFVATTRTNVSPSLVLELLQRIARVIKDYLGVLNEDSFRKNFVLVYELLDEVVDFGYVQTTSTEVLKSYVFNEPIFDYSGSSGSGAVILDDCNFHESVHLDSFDMDKTLTLVPSDGEFPVMNYRMTQEFKPPFRINALIEEAGPLKAEVILKIRAEFASSITANTIIVQMPLPTYTASSSEMGKRLPRNSYPLKWEVKYLQIAKKSKTYNPYRWVRYVTQANSYVARL
ncbi:clathrin adaptor complexes medium subunit family protein [Actinidia rufa]|uniref:Clathrin adaptor complexes medium subunit family protein n=1 Tax=Actinidia rufa TaxID=165716 RepID=A0A7J0DWC3_9ERIC|nr:clathrin adaptor complexes medium subunit family protein [Actinidia rufa]